MASRDHCLYLKDKSASDLKDSIDLYSNFTLSKGHKCTTALDHQRSKNVQTERRKGSNYDVIEKATSQKDNISLKKSYKNLPKDYFNSNLNDGKKESKTEKGPNKSKNASTLSLHIAAYENFIETQGSDSFDGKELRKKGATTKVSKNREQQLIGSFLNDQLEFPRQQEDEPTTPEIQQFGASQRLLTPKQEPFTSSVVPLSASIPEDKMVFDFSREYPFMEFDQFKLRAYSAKEIEKLSVLRIYQCKTFDALGFPIDGGLYDTAMGPFENIEKCSTCRQNSKFCPGHVGHICLEVPVFNPVYFPFMLNLLKGTCVNCHKFMCNTDGGATKILLAKLRCIQLGLVEIAEGLEDTIKKKLGNTESKSEAQELIEKIGSFNLHEIDIIIAERTKKDIKTLEAEAGIPSKNATEFKRTLLRDYMKTHLFRHRVKCPLCKRRNSTFRNDGYRAVLLDFGVGGIFGKASMKGKLKKDDLDDSTEFDDNGPIEEVLDKMEKEKAISADFLQSDHALVKQLEAIQSGKCTKLIWRGAEAREHFRLVWEHDGDALKKLFPIFTPIARDNTCPMDILFYETLIVPPNKFRPIRVFKGDRFEDPQTVGFRRIMETNQLITYVKASINDSGYTLGDTDIQTTVQAKLGNGTMIEKLHRVYLDLQLKVNSLYDSELNKMEARPIPGIRQLLEKKQGLFRMHMMGKRVNYACRSVITPDPYLDVDEIGIPEIFAKKLTFVETPHALNCTALQNAIRNGPEKYPGANFVQLQNGRKEAIHPEDHFEDDRIAKSRRLWLPIQEGKTVETILEDQRDNDGLSITKVFRQMKKGEMVLMNRQPSLHKPSIMGHRVRILKTQKALRMNYAPCKAYNADFDGDEMNGHFIQNRVGQVEAAELANVGSSYLVPKDGTPILGLIQDHVVSGVLLTLRDTFLNKREFMQLLLSAFAQTSKRIKMPPPAIHTPKELWTGKQIVTAIVQNCSPDNAQLINLTTKAKTSVNCWKVEGYNAPKLEMSESEVIFSRGALVNGVMDKAHFGATQYGLIHCCFELYGHKVATKIMSCFSRCFTTYLQSHGFTLGVADILVKDKANKRRKEIIQELRKEGDNVVRKTFGLPDDSSRLKIKHVLASAYNNARGETTDVKMYDFTMKQTIGKFNDKINEACVPEGLIRRFPQNSLQLMIQSGAKGSAVNAIQISCALGQIELEGQRPPLSATGRTLPSFWSFQSTPRAGGFVDQRFLTGINPQELFFHTMAGREGLIDTAVKTSRSGYLQRCIIKHLEGITVSYDGTCRDHDGSIVQFRYGEDGFDVGRATFLNPKQFPFLHDNLEAVRDHSIPKRIDMSNFKTEKAEKEYRKVKRRREKFAAVAKEHPHSRKVYSSGFVEFSNNYIGMKNSEIRELWFELTAEQRKVWEESAVRHVPDSVDVKYNPYLTLGALPEKTLDQIDEFYKAKSIDDEGLRHALFWKGLRALADPGENVGLLAAQSIGEPSTQMTLNTFHFAGRGDMNVTLGIPRLREILMTSGQNIATPTAEITLRDTATEKDIERLRQTFNRVYLKKCIKNISVKEKLDVKAGIASRVYDIGVEILRGRDRDAAAKFLKRDFIVKQMEESFIKNVSRAIMSKIRDAQEFVAIVHRKSKNVTAGKDASDENDEEGPRNRDVMPNDDGASSDEEVAQGAEDANEARLANRHIDDAAEYEGEEVEEGDIQGQDREGKSAFNFENHADADDDDSEAEDEDENDEDMNDSTAENADQSKEESVAVRAEKVKNSGNFVDGYRFDNKKHRWCIYTLRLDLDNYKVDINSIVESVVDKFIVAQTPKVEKCVIREENKNGKDIKILQTQGINVEAFYKNSDILDVHTIYSNDLTLMLSTYGIEACHRSIVREMNNVFGVYGIDVNPRHLTLVADYMTFTGSIAPFSRTAMASSTSPLQKMTFETTMNFMRDALVHSDTDYLNGPSSRLVTGQLIKGGTGCFELLLNRDYVLGLGNEKDKEEENRKRQKVVFTDSE